MPHHGRLLFILALMLSAGLAHGAAPATIAVLHFSLVDKSAAGHLAGGAFAGQTRGQNPTELKWARQATRTTARRLARAKFIKVLDTAPAHKLIESITGTRQLYGCKSCALRIGRALNADFVLTGQVQKFSNLILAMMMRVRNVKSGAVVAQAATQLRGNNEQMWARSADYLVKNQIVPELRQYEHAH
jgi:hypothetical protein